MSQDGWLECVAGYFHKDRVWFSLLPGFRYTVHDIKFRKEVKQFVSLLTFFHIIICTLASSSMVVGKRERPQPTVFSMKTAKKLLGHFRVKNLTSNSDVEVESCDNCDYVLMKLNLL